MLHTKLQFYYTPIFIIITTLLASLASSSLASYFTKNAYRSKEVHMETVDCLSVSIILSRSGYKIFGHRGSK